MPMTYEQLVIGAATSGNRIRRPGIRAAAAVSGRLDVTFR
jgi:hypothetical protein